MGDASLVNSRGDVLSNADRETLTGKRSAPTGGYYDIPGGKLDPVRAAEMLTNWLTAGGPPKKLDPSKAFGESEKLAGVHEKASAGQGINGLFGIGNMIGDLSPMPEGIKPLKMIEPINQSPMQTGVPYSALPVPGGK